MKKFSALVAVLAIAVGWTMTAYAGQCPSLIKQIDDKVATASLSEADAKKVDRLKRDGAYHHKKGEHAKSISGLNKALALLGG